MTTRAAPAEKRVRHVTPEAVIAKYFMEADPAAVKPMLNMIKGIINSRPDCRDLDKKEPASKPDPCKTLCVKTGKSMGKRALETADGDIVKAESILRGE